MTFRLGLILTLLGFVHLMPVAGGWDISFSKTVQDLFDKGLLRVFFRQVWFLGRTYFSVLFLIFVAAVNWKYGISAGICFLAAVGLERVIKVTIKRKRPFQQSRSIKMLQPVQPEDPSFPSGDCLRIWFIALLLPELIGHAGFSLEFCILLGISVTLGRMVMGVHFLTDVLSGTGLGIITASAVIYFWNFLIF